MDKQQAAREAMSFDAPQTAEAWAFAMAEACNAAMKAGARAEQDTFLHVVRYIQAQATQASRSALMPTLIEARDALQKAYAMLVKANLKEHSEENQRCGRCDYCEALLPNADDDDCGECYGIVQALARINAIIGDKK